MPDRVTTTTRNRVNADNLHARIMKDVKEMEFADQMSAAMESIISEMMLKTEVAD